jgi:hypothetical protein
MLFAFLVCEEIACMLYRAGSVPLLAQCTGCWEAGKEGQAMIAILVRTILFGLAVPLIPEGCVKLCR